MRKVEKILPKALNYELTRLGEAQNVMRRWPEVVGATLASRSRPDRYERGVLWVAVEGSAWAQELRLMKVKILSRLGDLAGQPDLFTDLRFGVRKLPPLVVEEEPLVELELVEKPAPVELSISEIAERRLRKWRDARSD